MSGRGEGGPALLFSSAGTLWEGGRGDVTSDGAALPGGEGYRSNKHYLYEKIEKESICATLHLIHFAEGSGEEKGPRGKEKRGKIPLTLFPKKSSPLARGEGIDYSGLPS